MGRQLIDADLEGSLALGLDSRVASTLKFIEKLTRDPCGVTTTDLAPLRESGVSEEAVLDAVVICAGFNVIVRVAHALGFAMAEPDELRKGAKFLLRFGYSICSGVWLRMPLRYHGCSLQRYRAAFDELERRVLESPGSLPIEIRRSVSRGKGIAEPLCGYALKVLRDARLVRDTDIALLRQARYSEDQIFEATICAALGAGLIRFEAGLAALGLKAPVLHQ